MSFRKWLSLLLVTVVIAVLCGPAVGAAEALDITAESVILVDAESGKVLYQKNPDKRLAPASMTKLMTLVLGVEALKADRVNYDETVVASENAWRLGGVPDLPGTGGEDELPRYDGGYRRRLRQ
jgi:D-alanyl-D-alanine carboxypeptidase (penicillin-binding protein 5/6)